jgi:crotonobetainyl-CoA:carnitine CoA-transferase CaiB-like acyl-CoA transferase
VIKVENPDAGDAARHYDGSVRGLSAHFVWLNRNKESLTLDLKHLAAGEILARLLTVTDVVVQNLAPGAAAQYGVDAATVTACDPRAVAMDISGYGADGPFEHKRAYDLLVQAESGSCSMTGLPGAPAKPGIPVADVGAGMYAFSGILAALYARERTGRGACLSVSMFDAVTEWMGFALNYTAYSESEWVPNGMGSPSVAPYGAYPTADGQTVVLGTTNDREWKRFAVQLLNRPDLVADRRYATNADRCAHREELDGLIAAWTVRHDLDRLRVYADAARIGNAKLNSVSDVLAHPQLADRDRWRDVASPVGPVRALRPPLQEPNWDPRMDAVPALGQHTDAILGELGFGPDETRALRLDGVV